MQIVVFVLLCNLQRKKKTHMNANTRSKTNNILCHRGLLVVGRVRALLKRLRLQTSQEAVGTFSIHIKAVSTKIFTCDQFDKKYY